MLARGQMLGRRETRGVETGTTRGNVTKRGTGDA